MKNTKGFFAGMMTMLLLVCLIGSASATRGVVQKDIEYRDIKVSLNGKVLDLKDAKGNAVEPFMFGGTNYIPARALAEALGLNVAWDSANATVVLTSPSSSGNTASATNPDASSPAAPQTPSGTGAGGAGNEDNFNTYDNSEQQKTDAKWVLNTSTLKIHYPSCNQVPKIAPENYETSNEDEAALLAKGYTTCGVCH